MTERRDVWDYTAGDSLLFRYAITDPNGDPLDLTGATIKWALATIENGVPSTVLLEKTVGTGISVIGPPADGVAEVTIAAGEISSSGVYWHELEVVTQYGANVTVSNGIINAESAIYAS